MYRINKVVRNGAPDYYFIQVRWMWVWWTCSDDWGSFYMFDNAEDAERIIKEKIGRKELRTETVKTFYGK